MNKFRPLLFAAILAVVLPFFALAQDASKPAGGTQAASQDAGKDAKEPESESLLDLIEKGGWAMWPLGLCSVGLITMVILNIRMVSRRNLLPRAVVVQAQDAAKRREVGQLYTLTQSHPCLFTNGLAPGLRKINPEDPAASKQDMENAIAESVGREEAQVGFWINFLSLITGVAPMIGLLGTVSGMIGAFQHIAKGGMGKPEELGGDIGEALITTATGLCIAIPAMFAYFIFRNNLSRIIREAEGVYSNIIDSLTGSSDLFAEASSAPEE